MAVTNRPPQPSAMIWDTDGGQWASAYATPGALVTVGRENYADDFAKELAAGGATVLLYFDCIIDNDFGRYHDLFVNESEYGDAIERWPGDWEANEWGYLNDFRPIEGNHFFDKLEAILELAVQENPHIGGFLMDDVGSRSWFPGFDFTSWSSQDKQYYRDGAIEICRRARKVCNKYGLIFIVNGTWQGGASNGGGYPNINQHGCSLADGMVWENHSTIDITFWSQVSASAQWATESPITEGTPFHWVWNINDPTTRDAYIESETCSHALAQVDRYTAEEPWGEFYDAGLPSGVTYPQRHNLSTNPSAKNNTNDWLSSRTITRVTGLTGMSRETGGSITGSGSGEDWIIPGPAEVEAGDVCSFGIDVQTSGTADIRVYALFANSSLTILQEKMVNGGTFTHSGIERYTISDVAPSNTALAAVQVSLMSSSATLTVTGCMIEKTSQPGPYADGDTPGWEWTGADGNSPSIQLAETELDVSGISATDTVGSLAAAKSTGISGVVAADTAGSLAPAYSAPISGVSVTDVAGSLSAEASTAITGALGTDAAGALSAQRQVEVSGVLAPDSVGSLSVAYEVAIGGATETTAAGGLEPSFERFFSIGGALQQVTAGELSAAKSAGLRGVVSRAAVGRLFGRKLRFRLIPPFVVERYQLKGSLTVANRISLTVYGDDTGLQARILPPTSEVSAAKYVFYGGYDYIVDDPHIAQLWVNSGFEVEDVP